MNPKVTFAGIVSKGGEVRTAKSGKPFVTFQLVSSEKIQAQGGGTYPAARLDVQLFVGQKDPAQEAARIQVGAIAAVQGDARATAYDGKDGKPKASLLCLTFQPPDIIQGVADNSMPDFNDKPFPQAVQAPKKTVPDDDMPPF